jgi:hypothetical protein
MTSFFEIIDHTQSTNYETFIGRISAELSQLEFYSPKNVESESFHYLVDHQILRYCNLPHCILIVSPDSTLEHVKMKSSAFQLAEWPVLFFISYC